MKLLVNRPEKIDGTGASLLTCKNAYRFHNLGISAEATYFPAHQLEHFTDDVMQTGLARAAEYPNVDPNHQHSPKTEEG